MAITITEYRNAVYVKADNSRMDVEVNHPTHGWIPFTLDNADTGSDIDLSALKTTIGSDVTAYSAPTNAEIAARIRLRRSHILIFEVDPIVSNPLLWADLGTSKQNEWTTYRTALLDIPEQSEFPTSVSWPTKPS
tara:strand:- start:32 stop:436 length:405 start_codon:yes stop_codon:yes gene_type:complete